VLPDGWVPLAESGEAEGVDVQVSGKFHNAIEGALAVGGDPATSPLYVFGPFLRLVVPAGVASVTFGPSVWLAVLTVAVVSLTYRLVLTWVTDGTGGSGLSEEEFGGWASKVNASITFVEYSLTFLVSMAALVTFLADRFSIIDEDLFGIELRVPVALVLSIVTGMVVLRGPRVAALAFGPATAGVLLLLWLMMGATVYRFGLILPTFDLAAFDSEYLGFTLGGYARILALMTGIEVFANLVSAYEGDEAERSRKAFRSLVIVMGSTAATMIVVGPAILRLSDPTRTDVSVFTQTMDALLPVPLAYLGTAIGTAVLLSACATALQGIAHLAHGLMHRRYLPSWLGQANRHGIARRMVWLEVAVVSAAFMFFGTEEETYLAVYAAGVFILLSMTAWAAGNRLLGLLRRSRSVQHASQLAAVLVAAILTSVATAIIVVERFQDGAWLYFVLVPLLYLGMTRARTLHGAPSDEEDYFGRRVACTCPGQVASGCTCDGCTGRGDHVSVKGAVG
jgi:hypothetical protein